VLPDAELLHAKSKAQSLREDTVIKAAGFLFFKLVLFGKVGLCNTAVPVR
jgi:hypothetical protein